MAIDILRAHERGQFDFGWLKTAHTFSFGSYMNPHRMGFGKLRVLNDDWVEPGMGFGTHPHRDMEILSIPLVGSLRHKDSLGHEDTIQKGQIQLISAGTGIAHSEYNGSKDEQVNFLQIWVYPEKLGLRPTYQTKSVDFKQNQWQTLVSPDGREDSLKINQDVYISLIEIDESKVSYHLHKKGHGIFAFLISGEVGVESQNLSMRDAVMLQGAELVEFEIRKDAVLLLIETPID